MNEEHIKNLIQPLISGCAITEIKDFGDFCAVYFQSEKYLQSQKLEDLFVGHGPYVIEKASSKISETGSAHSVEHYIQSIQACGSAFGIPTGNIQILGWEIGANKARATKLVQLKSGMNLQLSKSVIDQVFSNHQSIFSVLNIEEVELVRNELKQFGFSSKQLWNNQC